MRREKINEIHLSGHADEMGISSKSRYIRYIVDDQMFNP
jgi:hypothetical protein